MNKKVCGKCNLEFEGDLEKCPVCDSNLFEKVAAIQVAAIVPEPELYPEMDKKPDAEKDKEVEDRKSVV